MITHYRKATKADLETLINLLYNDPLGKTREDNHRPLLKSYTTTFNTIDTDPNNEVILACQNETILAMLQLTLIPYLTYKGSWRALIEGVRVHADFRGHGIGKKIIEHAMQKAKQKQCVMIQLTSDKTRKDAIRFYESLGFRATHEGLKYWFK